MIRASRFALPFLLLGAFCAPAGAQDNPLVQRGIAAEATAENAVQARERAFAQARRAAWQRLAAQTGSTENPSDSRLESMVTAIIVEQERTTPTRYVGRLTVQFASGTGGATRPPSSASAAPGGGTSGGMLNIPMAAVASVDAQAQFTGLAEWLELRRRLGSADGVAGVEVTALSVDQARLRLSLRARPEEAAGLVSGSGLWVDGSGPAWRVGLAGGR